MTNALNISHAYAESAKTHADLKDADRMLSALCETTEPSATVCQDTEAIHTKSAGSTSAWQIQSVQPPKLAEMKNVWIRATVQSMHIVLREITEESVHAIPAILEIPMASSVPRVSPLFSNLQLCHWKWPKTNCDCSSWAWPWLCNWWGMSKSPSLHNQAGLWRMCQPMLGIPAMCSKCNMRS